MLTVYIHTLHNKFNRYRPSGMVAAAPRLLFTSNRREEWGLKFAVMDLNHKSGPGLISKGASSAFIPKYPPYCVHYNANTPTPIFTTQFVRSASSQLQFNKPNCSKGFAKRVKANRQQAGENLAAADAI